MMLEGHFCWEDCDEGPHGCICGNDCEQPATRWAVRHVAVDGWPTMQIHESEQAAREDFSTCGMNCSLLHDSWIDGWVVV